MQEKKSEPEEGSCLQKDAAKPQAMKQDMEESVRLQREAAGLQEAMRRAVVGQDPFFQQETLLQQGPFDAQQSDSLLPSEKQGGLSPSQAGMLLLKVRVFLKTMRELEERSLLLGEKMDALQAALRPADTEQIVSDRSGGEAGAESPQGLGPMDIGGGISGRAVSERLRSLAVSRAMVRQIQAEAGALASAYGELESALENAGRAADQAGQIRLAQAAAEVKARIEKMK